MVKRENPIVNRLNKTKTERQVDHEQERVDRIKKESAIRRAAAAEKVLIPLVPRVSCLLCASFQKKADLELARAREAEKSARSYDSLFSGEYDDDDEENSAPRKTGRELEEDFM